MGTAWLLSISCNNGWVHTRGEEGGNRAPQCTSHTAVGGGWSLFGDRRLLVVARQLTVAGRCPAIVGCWSFARRSAGAGCRPVINGCWPLPGDRRVLVVGPALGGCWLLIGDRRSTGPQMAGGAPPARRLCRRDTPWFDSCLGGHAPGSAVAAAGHATTVASAGMLQAQRLHRWGMLQAWRLHRRGMLRRLPRRA